MKNQYRIKLEIKLKYVDYGNTNKPYSLIIKVLKKDNKFDIPLGHDDKYLSYVYNTSNGFTIGTNSYQEKGSIEELSFMLPNKKYLNRNITKRFETDHKRKTYLRHLHKALLEWSNKWGSFSKEPTSKFKSMNNKWYIYITKSS